VNSYLLDVCLVGEIQITVSCSLAEHVVRLWVWCEVVGADAVMQFIAPKSKL
jgi:hypothetical protein